MPGRPARYTACGTPISSKAGQTASDTPHPATDEDDQFYGSDIDRFYISTTIPLKILVKEGRLKAAKRLIEELSAPGAFNLESVNATNQTLTVGLNYMKPLHIFSKSLILVITFASVT